MSANAPPLPETSQNDEEVCHLTCKKCPLFPFCFSKAFLITFISIAYTLATLATLYILVVAWQESKILNVFLILAIAASLFNLLLIALFLDSGTDTCCGEMTYMTLLVLNFGLLVHGSIGIFKTIEEKPHTIYPAFGWTTVFFFIFLVFFTKCLHLAYK